MKNISGKYLYDVVATVFGEAAVVGRQKGDRFSVCRIMLPKQGQGAGERVEKEFSGSVFTPGICRGISTQISDFLDGKEVAFDYFDIDTDVVTGFARLVLEKVAQIPRGQVMTYQEVAESIGVSGGARAVGNALAANPFPLFFPCHRVIRSDMTLGGFGGGLEMKRALLQFEGVSFDKSGKVSNK